MSSSAAQIYYSDKYEDEEYEYRYCIVFVCKNTVKIFVTKHPV